MHDNGTSILINNNLQDDNWKNLDIMMVMQLSCYLHRSRFMIYMAMEYKTSTLQPWYGHGLYNIDKNHLNWKLASIRHFIIIIPF